MKGCGAVVSEIEVGGSELEVGRRYRTEVAEDDVGAGVGGESEGGGCGPGIS